jgi:hypothetical protein
MEVLLTILTVLALWALLGMLLMALLVIAKTLAGARTSLEKVAAGVRAIEIEVKPLRSGAVHLAETLDRTASSLDRAGARVEVASRISGWPQES